MCIPREYSDGNMMTVVKSEKIFHLHNIFGKYTTYRYLIYILCALNSKRQRTMSECPTDILRKGSIFLSNNRCNNFTRCDFSRLTSQENFFRPKNNFAEACTIYIRLTKDAKLSIYWLHKLTSNILRNIFMFMLHIQMI